MTFANARDNRLVQVEEAAGAVTTCTYNAPQERGGRDVAFMPRILPGGGRRSAQRSTGAGVRPAGANGGRRWECRLHGCREGATSSRGVAAQLLRRRPICATPRTEIDGLRVIAGRGQPSTSARLPPMGRSLYTPERVGHRKIRAQGHY